MSNQFTRLNLKSNNEWYTPKEIIIELIKRLNLPKESRIWCPFDNEESNFVQVLKAAGYNVVNTHINDGEDFFNIEINVDYIISNPPFKGKCDVIDRCIKLDIPYILLLGNSAFTQNGRMQKYLNNHKLTFIEKPVEFFNSNNEKKKFLCFWLESKKRS